MDFSHDYLSVSMGLSTGYLNLVGERSFPNLTTGGERGGGGEARHGLFAATAHGSSSVLPPNNLLKHCRSMADIDLDWRDGNKGPSLKLARTDSIIGTQPDLKMQIAISGTPGSLVGNQFLVSDSHFGSSQTNSSAPDSSLLPNQTNFISELPRIVKSEPFVLSCPRYFCANTQAMPYLQQPCSYRPTDFPLSFSREIVNQMGTHENDQGPASPFTVSQFSELQHQAVIFKYMMSGVNVPSELIIPIRNSFIPRAPMAANIAWGNYHLSFPNNTDPEPGRCRRTDGKKWRCAREVVPDQKYCERHMHRGRHRTRKTAQIQTVSSSQLTAVPTPSSATSASASVISPEASTDTVIPNSLQISTALNISTSNTGLNAYLGMNAALNGTRFQLPLQSEARGLFQKDCRYLHGSTKSEMELSSEQIFLTELAESTRESQSVTGLSMLSSVNNPWREAVSSKKQTQHAFFGSGFREGEVVRANGESEGQPLRHFFDDWPQRRYPMTLSWADVEEEGSNRNSSTSNLSISIPMTSSEFNTSTANSPRGKLPISPLKLSISRAGQDDPLEADPTHMELGVGGMGLGMPEQKHRQMNWIPIIWETSPLAEVLQSSTPRSCCKSSGLNLMPDGWENSPPQSPRMTSSPTGVLQNATSSSFSDSSSRSSARQTSHTEPALYGNNLRSSDSFSGSNIEPSSC